MNLFQDTHTHTLISELENYKINLLLYGGKKCIYSTKSVRCSVWGRDKCICKNYTHTHTHTHLHLLECIQPMMYSGLLYWRYYWVERKETIPIILMQSKFLLHSMLMLMVHQWFRVNVNLFDYFKKDKKKLCRRSRRRNRNTEIISITSTRIQAYFNYKWLIKMK